MRLKDKVSLVTGAAQGIGLAVAREFVRQGATVFLTDIQDEKGAAQAGALGERAHYLRLDVRAEDDWRAVTGQIVERCGGLDVVVNNAGITGFENGFVPHDPENVSLEDWHAVLATNLDGVLLGCKYAVKAMRRSGAGSIINVSSRSGLVGVPRAAAHAASKAAGRQPTKTVALY